MNIPKSFEESGRILESQNRMMLWAMERIRNGKPVNWQPKPMPEDAQERAKNNVSDISEVKEE